MVKLSNVTKTYKTGDTFFNAVDDVSLEIANGEFLAILGSSGSGKSTLLHLIGGLDKPTKGSIVVDGQDLASLSGEHLAVYRNKQVGFVFQFFNLLPRTSIFDNVVLPLIYAKGVRNRKEKALEPIRSLGLEHRLNHKPSELSGGEQQRVAIARALVNDPKIILADEPTGNLDSKTGLQILELFKALNKQGKTLVMVTHDQAIAEAAHRIIQIKDGKII